MNLRIILAALGCLAVASSAVAQGGKVEVLWLGQSAFRITTPGGKVIVTDPWLLRNPTTPAQYKDLDALGKVDVLLVTHGHCDHIADAPALAKLNKHPAMGAGRPEHDAHDARRAAAARNCRASTRAAGSPRRRASRSR